MMAESLESIGASEAFGISRAVLALMMLAGHSSNDDVGFCRDLSQDLIPGLRVVQYRSAFLFGEPPGLV